MSGITLDTVPNTGVPNTAYRVRNVEEPPKAPESNTEQVNFRGNDYDSYEAPNKSHKGLLAAGIAFAGSILTIGALAYAHKTNAIGKLGEGKLKTLLTKLNPAMEKCHEWCAVIKNQGIKLWDKVKNIFSKSE